MNSHPSSNTSNPWFVATLCLLTFGLGFGVATGLNGGRVAPNGGVPPSQAPAAPSNLKPAAPDDDFVEGDANAPVTIIEFSDYQCPFCRRFVKQTLPELKTKYIDTGKVKVVHRDFPLAMHPLAKPMAMAVECAQDQSNALAQAMYDAVFANQETGAVTAASIPEWAKGIAGLNVATWTTCYDANKHSAEIDADMKDGSAAGVSGTPSFWILGPNNQSKQIKGAQPIAAFSAAIDEMLK